MKRQFFTLVELLLVIAIIAILAGIAIPVVGSMNKKGKETKARSEINAIKLAFQQFETDYGAFPQLKRSGVAIDDIKNDLFTKKTIDGKTELLVLKAVTSFDSNDNSDSRKTANKVYDEFMQILTMTVVKDSLVTGKDGGEAYTTTDNPNTKRKRYLDPPTKKVKENFEGNEGYFFLDPWGRRYNIALDWNYDGKIENTSSDKFGGETENLMGKIFIFSYGDGNTDNPKNYITSWKTSK